MPPTTHRLTISIPAALAERLETVKEEITVSHICAQALEREVDTRLALREKPSLSSAIARLRAQRQEHEGSLTERMYRAGWTWVTDEASFEELHRLFLEHFDEDPESPFPIELLESFERALADMQGGADPLEAKLYALFRSSLDARSSAADRTTWERPYDAFIRGIKDAWNAIRDEVLRG